MYPEKNVNVKKLISLAALVIFLSGCCGGIRIKINCQDLPERGISIWEKDYQFVTLFPDLIIDRTNQMMVNKENGKTNLVAKHIPNSWGPDKIILFWIHENVLAHEMGHFWGYEHSDDTNSIMYPSANTNRDLSTFIEFM